MKSPQMPEPDIADVNPAAVLMQFEALGRPAHELDEQLCDSMSSYVNWANMPASTET
jgi:hypothetical protein